MEAIALGNRWAYRFGGDRGECWGLSASALRLLYRSCDALFNFGTSDLRVDHLMAPMRVYVESDPVTPEPRLAMGSQHTRLAFKSHDRLFSYGENYGAHDCDVPLSGMNFGPTRQAIDLELWHLSFRPAARYITTVGNYRQDGNDIEFNGEIYRWSKHYEWLKVIDLPRRTAQPFEVGMFPEDPEDQKRLEQNGWRPFSPYEMSLDVFGAYPAFIRESRAEFTVAKDQNVRLRSGWFSERDACYLASGKPVIAQDTGFSKIFPTGEGLFAFTTLDDALAAIDAINSDYRRQCLAARAIAEEYFEAAGVARRLLDQLEHIEPAKDEEVPDFQRR